MAHRKTERNPLFAGRWFEDDIILLCLRWYFRFKLSYRDLVEILGERGLSISHTTILRWVVRYAETCEKRWRRFERPVGGSWRLFERGDKSKLRADQVERIEEILSRLDAAAGTKDLNTPGYRLHPLKGDMQGFWSIRVSANWRIVFRFEAGDACDVDLTDYH